MNLTPPSSMKGKRTLFRGFLSLHETLIPSNIKGSSALYPYYSIETKPQSVVVLASNSKGDIIITHEFRYAVNRYAISIPGGFLEPNESAIEGAIRELKEETGYVPCWGKASCILLGECYPLPGLVEQRLSVVYISHVEKSKEEPAADAFEKIDSCRFVSYKELQQLLASPKTAPLFDAMALAALGMWSLHPLGPLEALSKKKAKAQCLFFALCFGVLFLCMYLWYF